MFHGVGHIDNSAFVTVIWLLEQVRIDAGDRNILATKLFYTHRPWNPRVYDGLVLIILGMRPDLTGKNITV